MAVMTHTFAHKLGETHWGKAIYAAFVAGIVFLVLQMLISVLAFGFGAWLPVRMIAAIALGPEALPETGFSVGVLVTAFLIHFGLALMSAWILAPIIQNMRMGKAILIGAAMGLVIYGVNFYVLTEAFSWFAGMRGLATLANHLIFGVVLAWTYESRRRRG